MGQIGALIATPSNTTNYRTTTHNDITVNGSTINTTQDLKTPSN